MDKSELLLELRRCASPLPTMFPREGVLLSERLEHFPGDKLLALIPCACKAATTCCKIEFVSTFDNPGGAGGEFA